MTESKLYMPDFIMISFALQSCESISDAARIYCGQLRAISNRYKYCWATDEELSDLKKKDKRTIQRWHQELEEAGFISRKSVNKPIKEEGKGWRWIRTRKMYIYDTPFDNPEWVKKNMAKNEGVELPPNPLDIPDQFPAEADSNNVYETAQSDAIYGEDRTSASVDDDKNDPSIRVNSQSQPSIITSEAVAVVVNFNLDKLDLTPSLRDKIVSGYTLEEIDSAVKRCLGWKGRPSDDVGIMTALNRAESWIDNPTPEEKKEVSKNFLNSLMKYDGKTIALTNITVGTNYIEFVSGMKIDVYNIDQPDFKVKAIEHLEKLKQVDEKLRKQGKI